MIYNSLLKKKALPLSNPHPTLLHPTPKKRKWRKQVLASGLFCLIEFWSEAQDLLFEKLRDTECQSLRLIFPQISGQTLNSLRCCRHIFDNAKLRIGRLWNFRDTEGFLEVMTSWSLLTYAVRKPTFKSFHMKHCWKAAILKFVSRKPTVRCFRKVTATSVELSSENEVIWLGSSLQHEVHWMIIG